MVVFAESVDVWRLTDLNRAKQCEAVWALGIHEEVAHQGIHGTQVRHHQGLRQAQKQFA